MRPTLFLSLLCTVALAEKPEPAPTKPPEPAPASPATPLPPAKPVEEEKKATPPPAPSPDAKLEAVASALQKGYGKLFEGTGKDDKGQTVIRMAGKAFLFDDGKEKKPEARIDEPDVEDMFFQIYPLVNPTEKVEKDHDPGRARVEDFFKLLYGGTEAEVRKNLVPVNFCGTKVQFSSRCGAADALAAVGKELDALFEKHPEMKDFTRNLAGTFQWRFIAGTKRLSNHSFGTAIDLNVERSAYWRWSKPATLPIFNRKTWPTELIEAFERHGFIWGGKWWHYDTMHFEFRPELIAYSKAVGGEAPQPDKPASPAPGKPESKASELLVPLQEAK